MQSKLEFSLDKTNNAIIKATIRVTDDVRDLIARQFEEAFMHNSNFTLVSFNHDMLSIRPLPCLIEGSANAPLVSDVMVKHLEDIDSEQLEMFIKIFKYVISQRTSTESKTSKIKEI